jgi:hypothetical protein
MADVGGAEGTVTSMIEVTSSGPSGRGDRWPALPLAAWRETYATLHMCTQVVGKVRLALSPKVNEWWHSALYVTARGLTTSPLPYGDRTFEIEFDFVDHNLLVRTSDGATRALALVPRTVAEFYREVMAVLRALELDVEIYTTPVEVPDPIPFERDTVHSAYDAAAVGRWWRVVRQLDTVFKRFRGGFRGKCSPVHFFWGSFDLAVTRFSGRAAPPRPGADAITLEAYDQEVISLGFWPGGGAIDGAALYSYTLPEPPGLPERRVRPLDAFYSTEFREFILMYDRVRSALDPEQAILDFAESTYEAGADLAGWDRASLEVTAQK